MIYIKNKKNTYKPLDKIKIETNKLGTIVVRDGKGNVYIQETAAEINSFYISGAIGTHFIMHIDQKGVMLDLKSFEVDCLTEIVDEDGKYSRFLKMLYTTMHSWWASGFPKYIQIEDKVYKYYVTWIRDHVHALKGMKYFDDDIKTGIELFADYQREDGMIWDKCKQMCHSELDTFRDYEFAKGDFVRKIKGNPTRRWMRIPAENDVEFLFIEGLYYTWKASGDDEWMESMLDNAIKAVNYSTSDEYRWSEKFQLLKRVYTIDSWDFQSEDDCKRSSTGTFMRVDPETSEFNVFHGDNTGMSMSCMYLSKMLMAANRGGEAKRFEMLSKKLLDNLNKVSWNGEFYTHMIEENKDVKRDFGNTQTDRQVSLSNTYAINRNIGNEKSARIIETYMNIRKEMPKTSAGEWYNIYPPFEKGFHIPKWEYMNGGVSTIAAGELSHGAFENGYEDYAIDILDRVIELCDEYGGHLINTFKGKLPSMETDEKFETINIEDSVNISLNKKEDEVYFDLENLPRNKQIFNNKEFDILAETENRNKTAIGISSIEGYSKKVKVAINKKAKSIYFLHTATGDVVNGWDKFTVAFDPSGKSGNHPTVAPGGIIGWFNINYVDKTQVTEYIQSNRQLENALYPAPDFVRGHQIRYGNYRIAWQGSNSSIKNVGIFTYGFDNPYPEKEIENIEFIAAKTNSKWIIAGLSLSNKKVVFSSTKTSYGIPDLWGASALIYSLIEGLAGIVDDDRAYRKVVLSPRWQVVNTKNVTVCAKYPASKGYVRYKYSYDQDEIKILVASNSSSTKLRILLPKDKNVKSLFVNDIEKTERFIDCIKKSRYLVLDLDGISAKKIKVVF